MLNNLISLVIPTRNDEKFLKLLLISINNQTLHPQEIIIVDSSTDQVTNNTLKNLDVTIPVIYHRVKKAYPGKARNIGVKMAKNDWIAFLDSKTIPEIDWLEKYRHLAQVYSADAVFGVTQFDAKSPVQKALRAATYGNIGHHTVPGTLIKKGVFTKSNGFLEQIRMGEDIEWREKLMKSTFIIHKPETPVITYTGLPENFIRIIRKYVTSTYHTARVNILSNIKDAYLSLALILSAIILPKWNYLISGWDKNPLFIPHITKIYLLSLIALLLIYQLFRWLFFRNTIETLFSQSLKFVVFIFITLTVYRWNAVIAGWIEDAVLYIPHITKIYVGCIVIASMMYRGIFLPLKRKVEYNYLFPFRWIQVGLLGLSLDLIKAPGYMAGAFLSLFKPTR